MRSCQLRRCRGLWKDSCLGNFPNLKFGLESSVIVLHTIFDSMKSKTIIILLCSFVVIPLFYVGCCKCVEGAFFSSVTSFRTYEFSRDTTRIIDTAKVNDTLFINLSIVANLVANSQINPFKPFVNTAYALSCHCGSNPTLGYTFPIDSITITSNRSFNGLAAGTNLSNLFLANYSARESDKYIDRQDFISIPTLLDSININKRTIESMTLIINPTPIAEKTHRFSCKLYSNGMQFTYASPRVVIWN